MDHKDYEKTIEEIDKLLELINNYTYVPASALKIACENWKKLLTSNEILVEMLNFTKNMRHYQFFNPIYN